MLDILLSWFWFQRVIDNLLKQTLRVSYLPELILMSIGSLITIHSSSSILLGWFWVNSVIDQ